MNQYRFSNVYGSTLFIEFQDGFVVSRSVLRLEN